MVTLHCFIKRLFKTNIKLREGFCHSERNEVKRRISILFSPQIYLGVAFSKAKKQDLIKGLTKWVYTEEHRDEVSPAENTLLNLPWDWEFTLSKAEGNHIKNADIVSPVD